MLSVGRKRRRRSSPPRYTFRPSNNCESEAFHSCGASGPHVKQPYLYAVVQRGTGRVHGQVPEGPDVRRPPALGFAPLDGQHVVGEDRPEGLRLQVGGGLVTFGAQLDSQVGCLDERGGIATVK